MHWPSILSYMFSSFFIVIFNKIVLTIFAFDSIAFIIFCQSIFTIVILLFRCYKIKWPKKTLWKVCVLNVSNVFFGISASGALNVAMFSALRRVSIFMTLIGQWMLLGNRPNNGVIFSVFMMILGAIIASADDLSFNPVGYVYVMANNALTASSQIETKRAIDQEWTKTDILFWSACLSALIFGLQLIHFDPKTFEAWDNGGFRVAFFFSMCLGFVIKWSIAWTIEKNDALTLAVAGSTKSAIMGLVVCAGLFDPTYVFSWLNFTGLQISAIASLCYVYSVYKKDPVIPTKEPEEPEDTLDP